MTHAEALDVLTALIFVREPGDLPSQEQKAAAEEHVASCLECWRELSATGTALEVVTPEIAERMRGLFGCQEIAEQLYKVAAIDSTEVARRFPQIAAHLARCASCQEILSDLECVSLAVQQPVTVPWRKEVNVEGGSLIRELIGDLVFRLREGMLASRAFPDWLGIVPIGADVGAMRGGEKHGRGGDDPAASAGAPGQRFHLDLDSIDLGVELLVETHGTERVRLEVQILRGERPVSIVLRRVEGDREHLVAAQDAALAKKFVAANLQPGKYHLEVRDHPTAVRRRIRLLLERG